MNGTPPDQGLPDEVDDRYRRAAALDSSRPSEAVRSAVLEHAARLAAQRAGIADPPVGATAGTIRPAQVRPWRRPAIFGTLAAAALAGLLITPHWLPPRTDSQKKAAESAAPRASAGRTLGAELPRSTQQPPTFVADEMRSPASKTSKALAASVAQQSAFTRSLSARAAAAAKSGTADGAEQQLQSTLITGTAARRTDATALQRAAEAGDMAALQSLLSRQTDVDRHSDLDARDGSGRTALMLATLNGRRPAVEALLAAGADPNAADAHGTTPLQAAIAGGAQPDIIAALQRAGAH